MISEKSGLVVPVVLWGPKPPRSRIKQISSIRNGQIILTGSEDGIVMQWMVDESLGWIQPQMAMLAHKTCISCISPNSTSVSASKFISCSEDGHICLWDSADGRIIDSMRTNYVHRKMKPYACKNLHEILFCVGDYTDVVAIHPHDLNVLYTLNSRAEPDWLNSITLVKPNDKIDVLIGVSLSGVAKLWSLNELNMKDNTTNILFEEESKFIAPRNVHSITCSEKNVRMMLVVCANSWQVIDPSTLGQLVVSECAIEALEGMIVDIDKVAIGFADSTIVLFQLPRSKLVGRQIRERFGEKPSNIAGIEQPFVFALLKSVASPNLQPLLNPVKFFFDSKLSSDKTHRQITYRLDEQSSSISFWHVPKNLELLVSEFVRTRRPIVYEPTIRQCLSDAWSRLSPTPPAIANFESGSTIQATIYVSTQDKLFLGRSDGSIMTMSACQVIMVALLDGYNNESTQFKILPNGHSSSVTCFLYPFAESNRYDPNLLLSGSADFSVIVWNVTNDERLHRFSSQGGTITQLLVPPVNCNTKLLDCVCCIAADNSACFVSLKKLRCVLLASRQQFPIVDIRWRPLSDQILLKCEDDSVYVWNIETGVLDQVITGLASDEILMNSSTDEQLGFGSEDENSFGTASQTAVQMLRALKQKDMAAMKKIIAGQHGTDKENEDDSSTINNNNTNLHLISPPLEIVQMPTCSDTTHLILFDVNALINGLLILDSCDDERENFDKERISIIDTITNYNCDSKHQNGLSNSNYLSLKELSTNNNLNLKQQNCGISSSNKNNNILLQQQPSLYLDTAKLLISLLHAWDNDESVDDIAINSLKLSKPKIPLCFGTISKGYVSLYTPYSSGKIPALDDFSFKSFSKNIHWQMSKTLTTIHLLAVVSLSNTLMALKNRYYYNSKRMSLRRSPSSKSTDEQLSECESHKVKQSWSNIAALHCILLPERIKPKNSYAFPKLDMLARKWQDSCIEIRDAAQALLIRELNRLGPEGRQQLIKKWANFLPVLLDQSISIFSTQNASTNTNPPSSKNLNNSANIEYNSTESQQPDSLSAISSTRISSASSISSSKSPPPPRPSVPPIPPRSSNSTPLPQILPLTTIEDNNSSSCDISTTTATNNYSHKICVNQSSKSTSISGGEERDNNTNSEVTEQTTTIAFTSSYNSSTENQQQHEGSSTILNDQLYLGGINQIRRNQATAIILLGVMGAEFPNDLQRHLDICRATAHSLLELLLSPTTVYPPLLIPQNSLLRRAAIDLLGRGFVLWQPHLDLPKMLIGLLNLAAECERHLPAGPLPPGIQLSPEADACRTARHALSLIASSRPQALITALNMEVIRYNAVAQHQTIQHPIPSPLTKSRNEVLRLLEQLSERQYNFVVDLIVQVGDILVHCLDLSLLKQRSITDLFPPIAKFYMVTYCPTTRRLAFGGKNGTIVIHELRLSKSQSVKAHNVPITALAFSEDGKYLAAYAAQEAKISFWQTQQTFLGMGQSQVRCARMQPAPGEFPVISPGGSYQLFRARLVWINSKSLTLMLPNGKENRFSV
uniref:WD_REPEATS_REGION domain-containing protein n=1 Tax=Meloidogyne incognita TaxID=6306 RepID=A0A914LM41_MELIC